MAKKSSSENREFFDEFTKSNSDKMRELAELKRKIEEFEFKHIEQVKQEKVIYNFYSYS